VLLVDDPAATPRDWLDRALAVEQVAGREREMRWGPRTLDVDVIAVDDVISAEAELTLPHPRAAERAFVLVPWSVLQPDARLGGVAIATLVATLPPDDVSGVRARPDLMVS
jgi:2-amino-4-hydroxy-6-hydroxymethyldihydropteridine diphosphokinase